MLQALKDPVIGCSRIEAFRAYAYPPDLFPVFRARQPCLRQYFRSLAVLTAHNRAKSIPLVLPFASASGKTQLNVTKRTQPGRRAQSSFAGSSTAGDLPQGWNLTVSQSAPTAVLRRVTRVFCFGSLELHPRNDAS